MSTVAEVLLRNAAAGKVGLLYDDSSWTYADMVAEGRRRADLFNGIHAPARPPHIGVLLDNVPDYFFWIAAAALSGATVVGINSTYRGAQLAQLIEHTDCEVLVTSSDLHSLLDGVPSPLPEGHILVVDKPEYARRLADADPTWTPEREPADDDLLLLIFTSGSTGLPKAVRCTQGRMARTGMHVAGVAELADGDAVYAPLPFFHSSSLFTGWASAMYAGIPISTRHKFSASNTVPDIRKFNATFMAYTGKILSYILTTPEADDDATVPLRLAIGNEASVQDVKEFARRFGCNVRDSYGSTEGVVIIRRDPSMPDAALGTAAPSVKVLDPDTGEECPPARFGDRGSILNFEEAVGEIVETAPASGFEGYYKNEEATNARFRDGAYWSGDLAYRDAEGWFYFAGRSNEWLRVDSENFAAAPVEAIIARHPDVRSVAIYAVPDDPVGDRVMAALELHPGRIFDAAEFDTFLRSQPDMGTKWLPSFVHVAEELPKLASMKIDKTRLRREAWTVEPVVWRPAKGGDLEPLDADARHRIDQLLSRT